MRYGPKEQRMDGRTEKPPIYSCEPAIEKIHAVPFESQACDKVTRYIFAVKEIHGRVRPDGIRAWLRCRNIEFVPNIIGIIMQQTVCYVLQVRKIVLVHNFRSD